MIPVGFGLGERLVLWVEGLEFSRASCGFPFRSSDLDPDRSIQRATADLQKQGGGGAFRALITNTILGVPEK